MSINVIMAVNETTWGLLKQNYERDEDGNRLRTDLTDAQANKLRGALDHSWNALNISGTNYKILDMYFPDEFEPNGELTWLNFLQTKWPNKFIVIAVFKQDGAPLGITIHPPLYDENGDILPNTPPDDSGEWTRNVKYMVWWKGSLVYPQHPRALEAMPLVNGQPATEFPDKMDGYLGWPDRLWI